MGKKSVVDSGSKGAAKQGKITGFFQQPKKSLTESSSENTEDKRSRSPLDNVTNWKSESEPVIASPEVKHLDVEVFDRTPEINPNKKRSKIKSRKTLVTGNASKPIETKFKRKLDDDDIVVATSPVFKKRKSEASKVAIDDEQLLLKRNESLPVILEGAKPPGTPPPPQGTSDDDDLWACFDDSPFKCEPEPSSCPVPTPEDSLQPPSTGLGRHTVMAVRRGGPQGAVELDLESCHKPMPRKRTATLRQSWAGTRLKVGDIIHLEADWDSGGRTVVDNSHGLLAVDPDRLVSSTTVVSALFCMRKAVLAEKFKGLEGGNRVMLLGTVVHELMQEVLKHRTYKRPEILGHLDTILVAPRILSDLAALGMSDGDMRKEVEPFVRHIQYFVDRFLLGRQVARPEEQQEERGRKQGQGKEQWRGKVAEVKDIEENFWSPRLGMKGKIDLTVETVELSGRRRLLPLEIKTGKPSYSTSHCGQVIIYCMMSADRREQPEQGLLLYLASSSLSEVAAGRNEQRGLLQLRNELVCWLRGGAEEDVSAGSLPEPVSHGPACSKCGYLGVCSLYQQAEATTPAAPHPMAELVPSALGHLQEQHVVWFQHWVGLLDTEAEVEGRSGQQLRDLWCLHPQEREERGQAAAGLSLNSVGEEGTCFTRAEGRQARAVLLAGEIVTVSSDTELALTQGVVRSEDGARLVVRLDRDLSGHKGVFCVDRFVYTGGQSGCYTGLARVMADTPAAKRLRAAVIDLELPESAAGLGKEAAKHGRAVMKQLNKVQQKAIFRTLMCRHYSLIRGMPGSGKTTTIASLVRLMVLLGQSVLVVAFTNSAVDTILGKLVAQGQEVLRLGRRDRVREELRSSTAEEVTRACTTPEELRLRLASFQVVGATCLGTEHAATAGRTFDWCVLDEASQAVLPSTLAPLLLAARFVLVGDPAQLPPTVRSQEARKGGLDKSLFSVLDSAHPSATQDLTLQYRMNRGVTALANHLTYEGRLECGSEEVAARSLHLSQTGEGWLAGCLSPEPAVVWADTCGGRGEEQEAGGISNRGEAELVVALVRQMVEGGLGQEEVGVIAPYSNQVKLLKASLSALYGSVEVGTVDQFQGRDKQVILYSCTRSNSGGEEVRPGHILMDTRRLNVAVTRAKAKLVILGDRSSLVRDYEPFRKIEAFFEESAIVKVAC